MSGMMAGMTAMPIRRVRVLADEIAEPAVVRTTALDHLAGVARRTSQPCTEGRRSEPTRSEHVGIGEQDLRDHALTVEDVVAGVRVEGGGQTAVAVGLFLPLSAELRIGLVAPHGLAELRHLLLVFVEARPQSGIQVVAVDLGRWAGVPISRDNQVVRHGWSPFRIDQRGVSGRAS